eukprot:791077-Rhodomonas_salina.1
MEATTHLLIDAHKRLHAGAAMFHDLVRVHFDERKELAVPHALYERHVVENLGLDRCLGGSRLG